jgi:small subunit ribosomal protein S4
MARYKGPKNKISRREGVNIFEKTSPSLARRLNIPPGQHGRKRKKRLSEFGSQLREKQKAKAIYGLMEKQFKNLFKEVEKKKSDTGDLLIALLETRLDNLVYRLGFAKTRPMARQLVSHGHVLVNDKRITIPSFRVIENDVISIDQKTQGNKSISEGLSEKTELLPFLERKGPVGKLSRMPKKDDIQVPFDVQLIIEYYSR